MRLNNKGFAISSILYMALVLFLILIMALLTMMSSRKTILDKSRKDTYNALNNIEEFETNINSDLDIAKPTMTDNMIPIVYSPSGVILKADVSDINPDENIYNPRNWYNYNQKKWANAVLVSSASLSKYQNLAPGENINQDDILAYFVWIPRYSYAVDSTNKIINVKFENKSVAKSTGTGTGTSYYTHPAFTFDSKELEGIWVGKFETTGIDAADGTSKITILPGKEPLQTNVKGDPMPAVTMSFNARRMEIKDNIYGFVQESSNNVGNDLVISNDTNTLDAHVLKNTEWGMVVLLSQSKYGINGDLDVNNSQNYCTGGGCQSISYIVNNNQSTTGNLYGIYDMANLGGELTMSYRYALVGLMYYNTSVDKKYYDSYDETSYGSYHKGIKGDATAVDNLDAWQNSSGTYRLSAASEYYLRGKNSIFSYEGVKSASSKMGFRISLAIWK